ncbi:MAG: hypothetical protein HC820_04335 [Hydrococcus sp. RM1_1_31]|nr:hypothetical protein [Hydrococcus sp. RM1_1_31]
MEKFFVGWHMPTNGASGTQHFDYCCISVNRLLKRQSRFAVNNWLLDSGAFPRISRLYSYKGHLSTKQYASEILRWKDNGNLLAAVTQDFMCESMVLASTGLTIADHQYLTIHRYDRLISLLHDSGVYINARTSRLDFFGIRTAFIRLCDRIGKNAWVGVGSVCKRQGKTQEIANILKAILSVRPDLRLHGFGVKKTALQYPPVWSMLYSADSAAAGLSRGKGKNKYVDSHNPQVALEYAKSIKPNRFYQLSLF